MNNHITIRFTCRMNLLFLSSYGIMVSKCGIKPPPEGMHRLLTEIVQEIKAILRHSVQTD